MKSFIITLCLVLVCTLQWNVVSSRSINPKEVKVESFNGDLDLPKLINLEDRIDNKLTINKVEYLYDEEGNFADSKLTYDIELNDCRLNKFTKKITCSFKDDYEEEHDIVFNINYKDTCKLNKKSKLVKADLLARNTMNKYGKFSNIAHYEVENDKIEETVLTAQKFEFTTNSKCKFTVNLTKVTIH